MRSLFVTIDDRYIPWIRVKEIRKTAPNSEDVTFNKLKSEHEVDFYIVTDDNETLPVSIEYSVKVRAMSEYDNNTLSTIVQNWAHYIDTTVVKPKSK